mgnify:CR=1 FL=1
MPRGTNSNGTYNFHVKRYVCPDCKRKGLYIKWYKDRGIGSTKYFTCMYKNCPSQTNGETLKRSNHEAVLKLNSLS